MDNFSEPIQSRYLITEEIGRGGMGAVYKAKDQRFRRTVALKKSLVTDEYLRRQFRHEAEVLAALDHPALPDVYDFFAEGDDQYLVMKYIPGPDLAQRISNSGPIPLVEILPWAYQLLDVLTYLHTQSKPVIHRDIKPHNLKLSKQNSILLLDFGLAKGSPSEWTHATTTRSIYGLSIHYSSFEQIQGRSTYAASDIFSFAATWYHLLTGEKPLDALNRAAAKANEVADPLRLANELNPHVPGAVARLLMRAMSLNPDNRPQTATAMREELRKACRDEGISLEPPIVVVPPLPIETPERVDGERSSDATAETLLDQIEDVKPPRHAQPTELDDEPDPTRLAKPSAPDAPTVPNADAVTEPVVEVIEVPESQTVLAPKPNWQLLAEFPIVSQNAWPLSRERVLVWQEKSKTLAIQETGGEVWSDGLPAPLRCVASGPGGLWAVGTWGGQVLCFADGQLQMTHRLDGATGALALGGERWLAGSWKELLVGIALRGVSSNGKPVPLDTFDMGVLRIAVRPHSYWFAVADLGGSIRLFEGNTRKAIAPSVGTVSSLAFAGRNLMALAGGDLVTIALDGRVMAREPQPGNGQARLLPGLDANSCLLLLDNGTCSRINDQGNLFHYCDFAADQTLLSSCNAPKRFVLAYRGGGCAYWRNEREQQAWPEALTANLSADGRLVTVVFADRVQLYEDSL